MTYSGLARTYPAAAVERPTSKDTAEDGHIPIRWFGRMLKRCGRLLPNDWRILLWSMETDEALVASLGPVEIRQVPACCVAETSVRGEMNVARGTALQRLAKYIGGENRRAVALEAERPILQQRMAPGLWQIAVRLPAISDAHAAPMPRTPKAKSRRRSPRHWRSSRCPVIRPNGRLCVQRRQSSTPSPVRNGPAWRACCSNSCPLLCPSVRGQFRSRGACRCQMGAADFQACRPSLVARSTSRPRPPWRIRFANSAFRSSRVR